MSKYRFSLTYTWRGEVEASDQDEALECARDWVDCERHDPLFFGKIEISEIKTGGESD